VFKFITHRSIWVNLLVILLISFSVMFLFFQFLDNITLHGKYQKVPAVKGRSVEEAKKILESQGFEVEVQDSVFYDSLPRLSIVRQVPEPGELVKYSRTIYLTVNRALPPQLPMPNFVGQTFRSVELQLKTLGLKLGDTVYKPDFAVGSILEQQWNGKKIEPGTPIPMGSRISLVIGAGVQNVEIPVPDLEGLTYRDAKLLLDSSGLLTGAIVLIGPVKDTASAFIIKQSPPAKDEEGLGIRIRAGQLMDLWLSTDLTKIDSIKNAQKPDQVEQELPNQSLNNKKP
jgi:beta-lactam-binding protein with PASTA domain